MVKPCTVSMSQQSHGKGASIAAGQGLDGWRESKP
jgi:hypothetical protein